MFWKKEIIVEEYRGSQAAARKLYFKDAKKKEKKGYVAVSENWTPGSHGFGSFIVALLLCIVLIGFLIFIYMLLVKPAGTLTVTYELKSIDVEKTESEIKTCPDCAETVKRAAHKCRYCGYEFEDNNA